MGNAFCNTVSGLGECVGVFAGPAVPVSTCSLACERGCLLLLPWGGGDLW